MRDALLIATAEMRFFLIAGETIVWTFIMPVIFMFFLGTVNRGPGPKGPEAIAVRVPADAGFLAGHVIRRLEQRGYRIDRNPEDAQRYRRRIEFPAGFTETILAGRPAKILYERTGGGLDGDYDRVRVQRAAYTALADLALSEIEQNRITAESVSEIAARPHLIKVESRPAGKRLEIPTGTEQAIPGTIVMFALLVTFTTGAVRLFLERDRGILRRLASTPMRRGSIVAGKWGANWLLAILQVGYALLVAKLMFGMNWGANWWAIGLVLACFAAFSASLGLLLGNFLNSQRQVVGIGVIASNLLSALGGCWWPIEITPSWAQQLARLLPSGWAMDAMHKLLSFGLPASSVLPHTGALVASTLAVLWIVARRFRFEA